MWTQEKESIVPVSLCRRQIHNLLATEDEELEPEYDGDHLSYEERVIVLQQKKLINELLFGM